jgi:hypothetical protein
VSNDPGSYSQFVGRTPTLWSYAGSDWELAQSYWGQYYSAGHNDADYQARPPSPLGPLATSTMYGTYPYR